MPEALRRAVQHRLDHVDQITEQGDPGTLLPLARAELYRLAESWRELLTDHQPDDDGRCRTCPPGLRRRRWPCQVWLTAHNQLIGGALPNRRDNPPPSEAKTIPLPKLVVHRVEVAGAPPQVAEPPTITELTIPPRNRPAPSTADGRLETDSRRIHRAAVTSRTPLLPRLRGDRPRPDPGT